MILVFTENNNGQFKKSAFEAVSYASQLASNTSTQTCALVLGEHANVAELAQYGADQIIHINDARLNQLNSKAYTKAILTAAEQCKADTFVFSGNNTAKAIAPRLSVRLAAGLVSGAVALPNTGNGYTVKKSVFSGKAFAHVKINTEKKIIAIIPNSFGLISNPKSANTISISPDFSESDFSVKVESVSKVSGTVPLSEAELVVSGGRGLKGPENWGIIEDLASSIGATLACSRPVADSHWRPHHEHVGQTGGTIRPNLYIAVGISGAIQHLAGVNSSKTIVVINKDPEAPFFKAADYGVVGDAFEVVPKLTEALKKHKAAQH